MKIHALEVPEDPGRLAAWLEEQLTSSHLGELVAELSAVHGSPGTASARDILGPQLDTVLTGGLKSLPPGLLQNLLRQPGSLQDLQEQVLLSGGAYWESLFQAGAEDRDVLARVRSRLVSTIRAEQADSPATISLPWLEWLRRPWAVSMATAAAVLLGVVAYQHLYPPAPIEIVKRELIPVPAPAIAWGWAKPDAIAANLPAKEYMNQLADLANQWSDKRPDSAAAVARRLSEFRQGCTTLFLAEHKPLAAQDRQWLKDKCRIWTGKLDNYLEQLEDGEAPPAVRERADKMVARLVETLREKAKEVSQRAAQENFLKFAPATAMITHWSAPPFLECGGRRRFG